MFLHVSICPQLGSTWPGTPPPEQVYPRAGTPPGQVPPWAGTPPPQYMLGDMGKKRAGTHPTGMHSC